MKKIFSIVLVVFFFINLSYNQVLATASGNIFTTKGGSINYIQYLVKKGAIENDKIDTEKMMSKAEFWKTALLLAGYKEEKKKKFFIVPISGIKPNKWYSQYAKEAHRLGLISTSGTGAINPLSPIKKLEAFEFAFKLFGVSTPYYNDQLMNFKDIPNDYPAVSKCMQLGICKGETNYIFGVNKNLQRLDAFKIIVDSYFSTSASNNQLGKSSGDFDILEQMLKSIENDYYKASEVDKQKLLYGAAEGLAEAVGDKYTAFMKPETSEVFNDDMEGTFEGIGAFIEKDNEGVKVMTPINGSPAQKAGILANDIILEVNGEELKDLSLPEAVKKIKGPKGSIAKLKVKRGSSILNFDVIREKIEVPSIEFSYDSNTLIVKLNQFSKNTDELLAEKLKETKGKYDYLVIDVRSNPGGYLDTVENILSNFIKTGEPIVQIKYPNDTETIDAKNYDKFSFKKIAILTNEASASASEILAGTLQDYGLATVVGKKTYGKGTVQTVEEYYDGSQFKYTIAQWLTAKGNSIQGSGVMPNIEVSDNPDNVGDEILNKALNVIGR